VPAGGQHILSFFEPFLDPHRQSRLMELLLSTTRPIISKLRPLPLAVFRTKPSGQWLLFVASLVGPGVGCGDSLSTKATTTPTTPASFSVQTVSVSATGAVGNDNSSAPSMSSSGRFVSFTSNANNLVPNITLSPGIYVRDTCLGDSACTASTVSVVGTATGQQVTSQQTISSDGRFVVFSSKNTSGPPEALFSRLLLQDTCLGSTNCTPSTTLVHGNAGIGPVSFFALSTNGRFTAYVYTPPAGPGSNLTFVSDVCLGASGCTSSIQLVSVANDGTPANGPSGAPNGDTTAMTPDGRFIVFSSSATNLSPAANTGAFFVYVRDTCAGALACTPSTSLISIDSQGAPISGSQSPSISDDGRFVAFFAPTGVFVRDTCRGAASCSPSTLLVAANGSFPAISGNGRFVAFVATVTSQTGVFVSDTCFGALNCTPSTVQVLVAADGTPGNGTIFGNVAVTQGGKLVAFASNATNLDPSTPNSSNKFQIFLAPSRF
jgi:hypothetical protein